MKRSQHQTHQLAAIHELPVPIAKPRFDQCTQNPGWWRLRGARLSLTRTYRESIALRFVLLQERIERESRELDRQCSDLMSDAARVGNDLEAMRRLSIRVAIFCQRVDALEETAESLLREREADLKAG
ncbi:MAG TPA: hypothetical protein VF456_22480 [Vicinamibacterales bacterium]